jgi:hypothetical protein
MLVVLHAKDMDRQQLSVSQMLARRCSRGHPYSCELGIQAYTAACRGSAGETASCITGSYFFDGTFSGVKCGITLYQSQATVGFSVVKKNQLDVTFVFFISLLIVAQHVSGNHVPIIRS